MELCDRSASELAKMLRSKEVSSVEITESVFRRIDEREKMINAFITVTRDMAFQQAAEADERIRRGETVSPLNGIPVAVKDILCTKGIRTTCGSRMLDNYIPPYDATVVKNVLDEGAVLVGKTNLDEFAMDPPMRPVPSAPPETRSIRLCDRGIQRRVCGRGRRRRGRPGHGHRYRRIHTSPGRLLRRGGYQAHLRSRLPLWAHRLRLIPGSGRGLWKDCGRLRPVAQCPLRPRPSGQHLGPRGKTRFPQIPGRGARKIRIGLPGEYFIQGLDARVRDKIMGVVAHLGKDGADIIDVSLPMPHMRSAPTTLLRPPRQAAILPVTTGQIRIPMPG